MTPVQLPSVPVIETDRLRLRGWQEQDLGSYAALVGDPEVGRYISGVMTRSEAWRGLASMVGHWSLRGFGLWAIERKSDAAMIGRIGLYQPEGWPGMEVGWALVRSCWGQGYATEGARASLDYGFKTYSVSKLISLIHPDNRASQRVADRLGETRTGQTEITLNGKSHSPEIWEISRERWLSR